MEKKISFQLTVPRISCEANEPISQQRNKTIVSIISHFYLFDMSRYVAYTTEFEESEYNSIFNSYLITIVASSSIEWMRVYVCSLAVRIQIRFIGV